MNSDYLFLFPIFLIGLITGYQDFKCGKIKNKWIILGLVWGIAVYAFSVIFKFFNPSVISYSYMLAVFINSGIALLVGYLFWRFNLWSAGDAKLFFVFAFLLPLKYYQRGYLLYFHSFALLVNVFVPAAAYLAARNLFLAGRVLLRDGIYFRQAIVRLKSEYVAFLRIIFGFFLTFISFQIIRFETKEWLGQLIGRWDIFILLAALAGIKFLKNIFRKNWFLILLFLLVVFYLAGIGLWGIDRKIAAFLPIIASSLIFTAIFGISSALLSYESKGQQKTMPFAVWLFLGVIITIVIRKSLISFFFF